jgi:hypothetical protein
MLLDNGYTKYLKFHEVEDKVTIEKKFQNYKIIITSCIAIK